MKRILCMTTILLFAAMANAQASSQSSTTSDQSMPNSGQSSSMGQSSSSGQSGSSTAQEQQLIGLEHQWADAEKNGNTAILQRVVADGYVYTDPSGKITGKQDEINMVKNGQAKYQTFDLSDMQAHVYGDTAVVTGKAKLQGTENGKDVSGNYAFTDTFVKKDGQWQAVATQSTPLSGMSGQSGSQPASPPPPPQQK